MIEEALAPSPTGDAETAPSEAPKPARRRRTTKAAEESSDQLPLVESVELEAPKKVTRARKTPAKATTPEKAAAEKTTTPAKATKKAADAGSGTAPATVASAPSGAPVLSQPQPVAVAPVNPRSAPEPVAPAPVASAPTPAAAVSAPDTAAPIAAPPVASTPIINPVPRDNGPREDNRYNNNGQNFGRDEAQNEGAPSGEGAPAGENPYPNQNGGDGQFPNNQRPFYEDGERGFEGRGRFGRNRNQMRREQRMNRNGRFGGPENGAYNNPGQPPRRREYDLLGLEAMEGEELLNVAGEFNIETPPEDKNDLIYAIIEAQAYSQNALLKRGALEILPDGKGFLRCEGYLPADGDVYVSQSQIKRFNLKTGDLVLGTVRAPKEMERFHGLLRVEAINGLSPEVMKTRKDFEKLTPIFPEEKFVLETEASNITARIIDLISPIGKGSRGLIVAPPKAGKTTLIKNIANSIARNHPEVVLIVLLIDERPEEVTDISRSIKGEVVASTFDEMPENHMRVADIVMEKAKRLVEMKQDVVILLDSITRLSRASNLVVTPSGRTLSGGLDPAAMYRPKRMFGAARNIEEGGSLTILATALVDTGSRMDEMIFEEFKGTGNLDLVLDRNLFDQRIFPAIDINRSGTRRDDLLLNKEDLATVYHLRRTLAQLDNDKAVTLLIDRLKNTKSNLDFMGVVAKSARNTGNGAG